MAGLEDRVGALEERMDHHAAMLGDIRSMVGDLRGDMRQLGSELRGEMGQLRNELRGEMGQLRGEMDQLRGETSQQGGQLRGEMGQLRGELHGFRDDMNRRFERVDQRFTWLVGIQMGTLIAIVGGLVGVIYR